MRMGQRQMDSRMYSMEGNRMDQRQMDQMRMIQGQMRMDQRQMDPMRMDQRQMYSMEGNQMNRDQMRMDQRQMDQMRMGQRHMDQRQMDEIRMDQRQLQLDSRMNMNNQMNIQGARRMMTKRETSPAFAYTIMTEHPSEMTRNMMKMEELRQAGRMSYRIPSVMGMMRPYQGMYMVTPAVGSNVAVYQNGQTYGFRTMA